jgi:sec-independent protein translocase protein TatA
MYSLFAFFGTFSATHWLILALILLLLFGDRLPKAMRSLGRGVVEFKKGVAGIEDESDAAAKKEKEQAKEQPKEQAKEAEKEKVAEEQAVKK